MLKGKTIRAARISVGESQTEFAERFGVKQSAVSDWEIFGPPARGAAATAIEREIEAIKAQNGKKKPRVSRETATRNSP